ncbi:87_t:CDS:2 [Rhizophagus irregularis]|nr:87_t:CDS:2 [Rhizophagus irregularis]
MNKSYKSLNPEKDFRQQIKSIFKACKVQQGQIATFPSPINIKNIKHLSTDDIGICHECNKKRPYKNWCNPCYSSHFKKSFGEKCWNRCNYGVKVILKTFMNDDDFADFLHEPKAHLNCCIPNAHISSLYESLKINLMNSLKNTHPLAIYSSKLLPTLFTDHDQDDNEDDDDQLSEYDDSVESSPLILLNNNNLL